MAEAEAMESIRGGAPLATAVEGPPSPLGRTKEDGGEEGEGFPHRWPVRW